MNWSKNTVVKFIVFVLLVSLLLLVLVATRPAWAAPVPFGEWVAFRHPGVMLDVNGYRYWVKLCRDDASPILEKLEVTTYIDSEYQVISVADCYQMDSNWQWQLKWYLRCEGNRMQERLGTSFNPFRPYQMVSCWLD